MVHHYEEQVKDRSEDDEDDEMMLVAPTAAENELRRQLTNRTINSWFHPQSTYASTPAVVQAVATVRRSPRIENQTKRKVQFNVQPAIQSLEKQK